jgi:hypothetical protein
VIVASLIALCSVAPAAAQILGAHILGAYTLMAPDGGSVVRVLTDAPACPRIVLDGKARMMAERAAPRTIPERVSHFDGSTIPAAAFPLRVCEAAVPRGTISARVAGHPLPLPRAVIRRIVVIGDTGCRLKASSGAYQACNDAAAWPFARLARAAAAAHPDLVLHVGDYHYRESPCPAGNTGCAGSPSGYGWEPWRVDFIKPAAPLLAAAPWAVARGNHEECARAGAGWWLLLDPHPLVSGADCADPARYFAGNHTAPYAVDLGDGARLIVADFAAIGEKPFHDDATLARYREDAATIAALAIPGSTNFVTEHYPFGAVTTGSTGAAQIGYPSIAQAFAAGDGVPTLPTVAAVLSGHVHLLQYAALAGHPPQLVAGFSGTQEDAPPAPLNAQASLPGGLTLEDLATTAGPFGYVLLERMGGGAWRMTAHGLDGKVLLSRVVKSRGG